MLHIIGGGEGVTCEFPRLPVGDGGNRGMDLKFLKAAFPLSQMTKSFSHPKLPSFPGNAFLELLPLLRTTFDELFSPKPPPTMHKKIDYSQFEKLVI